MPSRALENVIVFISVMAYLVAFALLLTNYAGALSASAGFVLVTGELIVWGYGIYWAFDIRRALSTRVFRSQALGMGLVSVGWAAFVALQNAVGASGFLGGVVGTATFIVFILTIAVTFYWVDSSIRAAQRTDPQLRDTLRWSRARYWAWAALIGGVGIVTAATYAPQVANIAYYSAVSGPILIIFLALVIVVPGVTFAVSIKRSKDAGLRRHLMWFGLGLGAFVALLVSGGLVVADFVLADLALGYCLYKAAKSLAPLGKIPQGPHASANSHELTTSSHQ